MTEDIDRAAEGLAALARIPSLWDGIATFKLDEGLEGPRWYEAEDWTRRGSFDHVAVPMPVDCEQDDDRLLERCRLELRHGLERLALELTYAKQQQELFGADRSAVPKLVAKAEGYLEAMG